MQQARYGRDLVAALLREQHPDLAGLQLRYVQGGWDNELWRLGDELGVRLPCTERAPGLLRAEQTWLPGLAQRLPLPVPVPVRVGNPSPRFARPWTVTRWVDGEPADRQPVTAGGAAEVLAAFLRALHQPAPPEAPRSTTRGVPLQTLAGGFDLAELAGHPGLPVLREVWAAALSAPQWGGTPRWLHGDLHPANVVTRDGDLVGVLDFGDLSCGDPATDLSAAWILLPDGAAQRFLDAYGDVDPATTARARGWALLRAVGLVQIGRAGRRGLPGGKPTWEPAGLATLDRLLRSSTR